MHVDYPWDVALSQVVSVPVILQRWHESPHPTPHAWVLHESGHSLLVLGLWPWSHLSLIFITVLRYRGPRPEASLPVPWPLAVPSPPRFSLPVGMGVVPSEPKHVLRIAGYAFKVGDAQAWRRPKRSTYWLFLLGAPGGSHRMFDFG